MHIPVYISQHLSPFSCCRQPINSERQMNVYQSQLMEPMQISSSSKQTQIKKIVHINDLYKKSKQTENNFRVVAKSKFSTFLQHCQKHHSMFNDSQLEAGSKVLGQLEEINREAAHNAKKTTPNSNKTKSNARKIVWRRLSQMYSIKEHKIFDMQLNMSELEFQAFSPMLDPLLNPMGNTLSLILQIILRRPQILKEIFGSNRVDLNSFGIYKLVLNDRGYPRQIILDDYVPVYQNSRKHAFCNMLPGSRQLWPLLIQKGLAKVKASYQSLYQMKAYQILRVLTVAPTVKHQISDQVIFGQHPINYQSSFYNHQNSFPQHQQFSHTNYNRSFNRAQICEDDQGNNRIKNQDRSNESNTIQNKSRLRNNSNINLMRIEDAKSSEKIKRNQNVNINESADRIEKSTEYNGSILRMIISSLESNQLVCCKAKSNLAIKNNNTNVNLENERIYQIVQVSKTKNRGRNKNHSKYLTQAQHIQIMLRTYDVSNLSLEQYQHFQLQHDDVPNDVRQKTKNKNMLFKNDTLNDTLNDTFKLNYSSFLHNFDQLYITYFHDNYNFDFQIQSLANRQPSFHYLKIEQASDIILNFSKINNQANSSSFIPFSLIQTALRNFIGIQGGWLKLIISKLNISNSQTQFQYIHSITQTEDTTLSINLKNLSPGQYLIYTEAYSEQNFTQHYVVSVYSQNIFFLTKDHSHNSTQKLKSISNHEHFLQELMLNHCLKFQEQVVKNYFISGDGQSWYASHLLYQKGSIGYIIVYLSEKNKQQLKISFSKQTVGQQGYKVQCKRVKNKYQKIIRPGEAQVIVLSLNYCAKKIINKIEFPPKSIRLELLKANYN